MNNARINFFNMNVLAEGGGGGGGEIGIYFASLRDTTGTGERVATSTDLVTWNVLTLDTSDSASFAEGACIGSAGYTTNPRGIEGLLIVYSNQNTYSSIDGVNWTSEQHINLFPFEEEYWYAGYSAFYDSSNDSFIGHVATTNVTDPKPLNTSTTGTQFTTANIPYKLLALPNTRMIYSHHGTTIYVGDDYSKWTSRLIRTTDGGANWTEPTTPYAKYTGIAYSPTANIWVATGGTYYNATSDDDGITWTLRDQQLKCVEYNEDVNEFVSIRHGSTEVKYSQDGITWGTRSTGQVSSNATSLHYIKKTGKLVSTNSNGTISVSDDNGATFTTYTIKSGTQVGSISWG